LLGLSGLLSFYNLVVSLETLTPRNLETFKIVLCDLCEKLKV